MRSGETRRSFLTAAAAGVFMSRLARPGRTATRFDPDFATATDAVRAIRDGAISARELLDHTYDRIAKYEAKINAFVTMNETEARQRAAEADEAQAHGKVLGPLHGLPILIKDSFRTAGLRTTSGSKQLEEFVPPEDAIAVSRLRAAGGIIVGKTNLPEFASDLQSFNEVAGTTNNPWDTKRTPGGSTGGGAAALAAGFGFLELGSDIGGSIRTPAHFCGVYGHKSSLEVVPLNGHIPPPPGASEPIRDLPVAGPLARSAQDLRLELEIIAGPVPSDAIAYSWRLPSPRGARLKDYRMGFVLDDPFCPVPPGVREPLQRAIEGLNKAGVELREGWPEGVNPAEMFDNYLTLLAAFFSPVARDEEIEALRAAYETPIGHFARLWYEGTNLTHKAWLAASGGRLKARSMWQEYFRTYDAFLMPENFVPAILHNHEGTFFERSVATSQGPRLYADLLRWISFATLSGCPASVAPVGRTNDGLPVGIQIMGPFLEDATPIDIAGRLADIIGGFEPPPAFRT